VFADAQFHAWGRTWDGLEYELQEEQTAGSTAVQFTVSGAPKGSIHIPQIVGPWDSAGKVQLFPLLSITYYVLCIMYYVLVLCIMLYYVLCIMYYVL